MSELPVPTRIRIGNMVCLRCILVVRELASKLGPELLGVELGHVKLSVKPPEREMVAFASQLDRYGFEVLLGATEQRVEAMRLAVRATLADLPLQPGFRLRAAIAGRLDVAYALSAAGFRAATGETIQRYFNRARMVKACELVRDSDLQISEVGYRLGYSNVSAFSRAFEREVGSRPTAYRDSDTPRPLAGRRWKESTPPAARTAKA